jgi:hypothetical protein
VREQSAVIFFFILRECYEKSNQQNILLLGNCLYGIHAFLQTHVITDQLSKYNIMKHCFLVLFDKYAHKFIQLAINFQSSKSISIQYLYKLKVTTR